MRCTDGNGCSGEMWSPLADSPPKSVAPSSTSGSHQSERFGGICTPTSGIRRRHSRTSARMSSSVTGVAQSGGGRSAGAPPPPRPPPARARGGRPLAVAPLDGVGDLRRLTPVVARVRHVVLEDHLLEVPVLAMHVGERL